MVHFVSRFCFETYVFSTSFGRIICKKYLPDNIVYRITTVFSWLFRVRGRRLLWISKLLKNKHLENSNELASCRVAKCKTISNFNVTQNFSCVYTAASSSIYFSWDFCLRIRVNKILLSCMNCILFPQTGSFIWPSVPIPIFSIEIFRSCPNRCCVSRLYLVRNYLCFFLFSLCFHLIYSEKRNLKVFSL